MNRQSIIAMIVRSILGRDGDTVDSKSFVRLLVIGAFLLVGFLAYRLLMLEFITNLMNR